MTPASTSDSSVVDVSDPDWVLLRFSDAPDRLSVFNRRTYVFCLIEDDEQRAEVCAELLRMGRPVLDDSQLERREFRVDGG